MGKLTNQNQKMSNYGYISDEVAFRVKAADLTMDQLYEGDFEMVGRFIGPNGLDELKKFVSYIPKLELDV